MYLRTSYGAGVASHGKCERLLAELGDISDLDLKRRESQTLSDCVQTLERALSTTSGLYGTSLEILDYLAFGTGVLDDAANVLQSNRYLTEVIEAGDGLHMIGGRLCARRPQETQEIRERIAQIAAGHGTAASAMTATRNSGLSPLLLVFAPVTRKAPKLAGCRSLLFVVDPDRSVTLDAGLVQSLFGLTRTESRIAARLAQGMRLDDISASFGVATCTARSHLKHIFGKTRTERQADLTMRLRGLLGSLRI